MEKSASTKTVRTEHGSGVEVSRPISKKRVKSFDLNKLVEEVFDQVNSMFSLTDTLELSADKAHEIVREIVEMVASGYSSKPSAESIVKKIKKNMDLFSEYVATKILELDKLNPTQLEFVITRGGRAALAEVNRVYNLAVKYNRDDLVAALRQTWNNYGPKGLLPCPRCGFNAITPDKTCSICEYTVPDEYIRTSLGFKDKFEVYLKSASVAELNEVLQLGYVLLGERGVYNPRSKRARVENSVLYSVYLRKDEISRIIEELNSRELPI